MTQDKELLIQDLCARLPYGVKVNIEDKIFKIESITSTTQHSWYIGVVSDSYNGAFLEYVKPYLFPIFSNWKFTDLNNIIDAIDWFNKHHIDYKGLINKGLAIDATNLNIY